MSFQILQDFFSQLRIFAGWALWPTIKDVWRSPSLLLHPMVLRRTFFTHLWAVFSKFIDQGGQPVKQKLITPNAYGIVLDIGAGMRASLITACALSAPTGHGHTATYLDRSKVTKYIALEPNARFHAEIRRIAGEGGFVEADGTLLILGTGGEDCAGIVRDVGTGGVDTLISILSFCSVPHPDKSIRALVQNVLKPGGQLLSYEHVDSPVKSVRFMQTVLNPGWKTCFDGCNLGRPIFEWIRRAGEWVVVDEWSLEDENPENLFYHRVGRFVKGE